MHHTASASSYSASDVPALIRGFYRFHVLSRGWFDIGYNYLVDRYGRIYEGRSGGITRNVRGAQVAGFNTGSAGVALIGNYNSVSPTDAQLAALRDVIAWRLDLAHVDPLSTSRLISGGGDRYAPGAVVAVKAISGHRDVGSTDCPGTVMYRKLPALREEVAALPLLRDLRPRGGAGRHRPDGRPAADPVHGAPVVRVALAGRRRGCRRRARWPQWTGSGTAVDATWTDPVPTSLTGLRWRIEAGTARAATGAFNDLSSAPSLDVVRGARIASAATGNVTVAYSLTASARISTAITDDTGKLVKVLDAGTRRSRGAQQLTWSGPSGHYRAVLRMARAAGVATITLPFDIRRGVVSVTLTPAVVNARGPARVALRARRIEAAAGADPAGRLDAQHRRRSAREDRRQLLDGGSCPRAGWSCACRSPPRAVRRSSPAACWSTAPRRVRPGSATAAASCAARCRSAPPSPSAARTARSPGAASPSASAPLQTLRVTDVAGNVRRVAHP